MTNNQERPLKYYWQIIKSRKWILILTFLVTVISTTAGSLLWTPSYEATATILLDYANPNPLDVPLAMGGGAASMEYMITEMGVVTSEAVALRVIDALKMAQNPSIIEAYQNSSPSKWARKFLGKRGKDIKRWLVDFLSGSLTVAPQDSGRILAITFESADPNFSAAVANAFAWAYNTYHLELKIFPLKESVDWISRKVDELRLDVEKKERGLEEYKTEKGVVNPQDRYDIATQKLNRLNADMVSAETMFYETVIKINLLKSLAAKGGNYESLPEVIANSLIQNLKVDKIRLEKQLSDLSGRVGTNHPQYLGLMAELQTVKEKMSAEIDNIVTATKTEYESAKERRAQLKTALAEQKEIVLAINRETFDLNMLNLEAQTTRRIYDALLTKFSETTLRGDINRTNVIIIDKATPPSEPVSPKIFLNIVLSVVVGFFLGVGVVFFLDFLDNTIKGEEEIEADFGLAVLGVIPRGVS